jgi:hypothetical protein
MNGQREQGGSRREQRSWHAGENSGRARARASPACREEGCAERRQGKDPGSRRGWALYGGAPRAYIKGVRAVLKIQRASDVEDEDRLKKYPERDNDDRAS